ncbi:DNA topoisomerase I, mitochondrial isoform X2 [Sceloporus undulatus]|uniref:DNA topoisomerase I, mitochondrial isoform X2 n=1 Tax=Sceloporus undulatus TaxID=8520 RepID=UPI001C4D7DA3|nr:DNA topoisomerase I, mitochondrial isoform X2 [Sceloporus undulatus]
MTDREVWTVQTMGDAKKPLLMKMPDGENGVRNKKQLCVSPEPKRPKKPREKAPAKGQQETQYDEKSLKGTKKKHLSKEKPLQENTISSSIKSKEASRIKATNRKVEDGNTAVKTRNTKHQGKAESSQSKSTLSEEQSSSRGFESTMDFADCNGHAVSHMRIEPVRKKIKLETEERVCTRRDENKTVSQRQVKKELLSSETDHRAAEERTEKKKASDVKQENEKHEGQEVRPGGHGKAKIAEEEKVKGRKEENNNEKWLKRERKSEGEEGEDVAERRKTSEVKSERENSLDGEKEMAGRASRKEGEELVEGGPELGLPLEIKQECSSEEQKPAKRKKRKDQEVPEDGRGEKAKRKKSKRATSKAGAGRCSRKRKAEEEAGAHRKKKKRREECGKEKGNIKEEKWKWWEEEQREDGVKWHQLEHKGPYFAPLYEPLPKGVNFYYNGKPMKLSPATEEIATFFAKMLDHEYTSKAVFRNNFFCDWIKEMTPEERKKIKDLKKCDFREIHQYFVDKQEAQKALPKEEKQKLKAKAEKIQEEYGYCIIDGHREKIGNFKTEPPGLFRGRGDHPKMGMIKKRIMPEDVIINCSKDSKIPRPPRGHRWKEVRSDNTVTWLASWTENIQGAIKYIMLNPSSKLKGEKDWQKYEVARCLKGVVGKIRSQYRADWKSKEMKKRQRSVALYFIDRLALRAGNEKEEGETADTVGCCSLRVEHITLHPRLDGKENVVEFDFLGKDCIRYYNKVPVERQVFKNLQLFMENKDPGDCLFDRLSTTSLNKHLQDLMDGLTAKVFRTYNASITLQEQLDALTYEEDSVAAKLLSYNRANRAVAILCNHQRATPKTFEKSMQNLQAKIDAKKDQLCDAKMELKRAKADHKAKKDAKSKAAVEKKKKMIEKIEEQLAKLDMQATDKEENKQIALGTSKLNYLDPRISVAWCKRFDVPIEKIYNKTQREKFAWAIAMADEDFEF